MKCFRTLEHAVLPNKAHPTDVGYDLTVISVAKRISDKTCLYETGLVVCPPEGYYFEIVPRSSLCKTGHMMSNSIGIIDPDYRGTLKIPVTKIDDSMPDLTLPFCRFQLLLRPILAESSFASFVEVQDCSELSVTERGSGGFGSTDKKE
jgi:dUTP pyrophosphatase